MVRSSNGALMDAALFDDVVAAPEVPVTAVPEPEGVVPELLAEVPTVSKMGDIPEAGIVVVRDPEDITRDSGIKRVE